MKNHPNKTTVKDGLPTAEQILHKHFIPIDPFDNLQILQAMQSYSDQQNAELRERVKELEAGLAYSIEALKACYSLGASKPIIERLEKTLKK